jgi:hypothetical protein
MKRIFLMVSIIGVLVGCNNSSNDDLPTLREINELEETMKRNSTKNKSRESNDVDMDKACQCYEDIYEQHKELYEMSDSERRENKYKWDRIKGKSRNIECVSAMSNLQDKYGDDSENILKNNCQAARDVEMMRQKLRNFYD